MEDRKRGRELGADGYLVKAKKTPQQVLVKVKEMLNKKLKRIINKADV